MEIKREIVDRVWPNIELVFNQLKSDTEARQTLRLKNFGLGVFEEFVKEFQKDRILIGMRSSQNTK